MNFSSIELTYCMFLTSGNLLVSSSRAAVPFILVSTIVDKS
jgi:hypothetical protein